MRVTIMDEFTDLPVSSQRKTQLRWAKAGRCIICGRRASKGRKRCGYHVLRQKQQNRRYRETHPGYWENWPSKRKS